jgi:hypothetical protein
MVSKFQKKEIIMSLDKEREALEAAGSTSDQLTPGAGKRAASMAGGAIKYILKLVLYFVVAVIVYAIVNALF